MPSAAASSISASMKSGSRGNQPRDRVDAGSYAKETKGPGRRTQSRPVPAKGRWTSALPKGCSGFIPGRRGDARIGGPAETACARNSRTPYVPSSDESNEAEKGTRGRIRRALQGASDHGLIKIEATEEDEIVWKIEQPL